MILATAAHLLIHSVNEGILWVAALQAAELCVFASSQKGNIFVKNIMSFNSSALNPNQHNSPNKHNCVSSEQSGAVQLLQKSEAQRKGLDSQSTRQV